MSVTIPPAFSVGYSGFPGPRCSLGKKKCGLKGLSDTGVLRISSDGSWRHWACMTAKNMNRFKANVQTPAQLIGFDALRLQDKKLIAVAMNWQIGGITTPENIPNDSGIITNNHYVPNLNHIRMLPSMAKTGPITQNDLPSVTNLEISAHDNGGATDGDNASPPMESTFEHKSRKQAFEPIVVLPQFPLPSLDFRTIYSPRPVHNAEPEPVSNNTAGYRDSPSSVVGKRFRFVDANQVWEVSQIVYGRKGWGMVTIEAGEDCHRVDFEVLMSMIKHGVLEDIEA